MNLTRCDNCEKEKEYPYEWIQLRRKHPHDDPSGGIVYGRQELDFCSERCVMEYLTKESE